MYNYDFKDKWHASQLNTADKWDVDRYRKETLAREQKHNGVKLNNYFSYGDKVDTSATDPQYKYSNNKVESKLNNLIENYLYFQVPKHSSQSQGNPKPEWKNVYRSESVAAPASGNVNPFKYSY